MEYKQMKKKRYGKMEKEWGKKIKDLFGNYF